MIINHIYSLASHHALSPKVNSGSVTGSCGLPPVDPGCCAFLKAATQHPGNSSPPSLLRWGCCSRMCIASFSNSSLWVLAWSVTVASSHLIGWQFSHACSARADFSSALFWHASRCSFILVSSLLTVSPMYFLPQLQGIWHTTLDLFSITRVSFTLVSMDRGNSPDLKTTFRLNFLQTRLMSSLTPSV